MAPSAKRRKTNQPQRFLCFSCDVERTSSQFPDYNPSPECEHLINTCKACLKGWVEAQVESGNFTAGGEDGQAFGVRCPHPDCKGVMKNVNVGVAATKKVYERFDELERKHIADNTPGWRWCFAPGCKAGQVHEKKAEPPAPTVKKRGRGFLKKLMGPEPVSEPVIESDICECTECGAKACVPCDRPWHEGEDCAAYQARIKDRLEEENKTLEAIQKVTKKCPRCQKNIEKNGGCSNMICSQCHANFCWNCLTRFTTSMFCKCHPPPGT